MSYGLIATLIVLAIVIGAITTKKCEAFLIAGSMVGAIVLWKQDFLTKWVSTLEGVISDEAYVILICGLFGSLVALLTASRGSFGFTKIVTKICNTERKTLFATFILGILIFVDDYLNVLSIGTAMKGSELTRTAYQKLLNDYAKDHERQTTLDFHHQLKGAILDAVDDGLIERDPTRKAIIKGKSPRVKKIKYLNQFELHTLIADLDIKETVNWDWFILLVAKTGMRFSEALAITPADFDFARQTLSISKTWDYKGDGGFLPTKNKSSVRKIQIDWQIVVKFSELTKNLPEDHPIFVGDSKIYNSTVNDVLTRHCKACGISEISVHGLRHTHASLLLFAGVSIASVARRLGHASMTTTQKTYLHIIQELENKDVDLVMRTLSGL